MALNIRLYRTIAFFLVFSLFAPSQSPAQIEASPQVTTKPQDIPLPEATGEDWTTISLATSGLPLQSIGGVPLSKVDLPGCTRELFRMQWRANDPIDLYVTRPRSAGKLPVVLFLYNYNVDTDVFREDRWCEKATRNGFAVVGFPSALSWQRLHAPRPMKDWFVSDLQEALATSTHDVQMVLNYLETRGDLDVGRVGIFGQGSGGAIAILAAAADSRISALDLMDPWGDWPDWLKASKQIPEEERPTYMAPEFEAKVAKLDPVDYLSKLKAKSILIQQTADDTVTPAAAREKIAAALSTEEVALYPDRKTEAKALGANGVLGWLGSRISLPSPKSAMSVASGDAGNHLPRYPH